MSGGQHPPRAPQAPMQGGRDWDALQARAVRRLEARAVVEQRQAGEAPVQGIPSLTNPQPDDMTPVAGRVRTRMTWFRTTFEAVFRRSGRTRRR
jgi:hypothetical protein